MSISMNNHETRIKALEKDLSGGMVKTSTLYSGSTTGSVVLSQSSSNFDFLFIRAYTSSETGYQDIIPKIGFGMELYGEWADARAAYRYKINGNIIQVLYNWNNSTKITNVYGIKIAKTVYYTVLELINNILREVI